MGLPRRVLLAALLAGLAACNAEPDRPMLVRVSSLAVPGTPWHDLWLRFAERLRAASAGDVDLELYIAGELGAEEAALANLRRGRFQIAGFSLQGLATVVPELNVLLAPYLFESRAKVDFVMDRYLTPAFRELFAARGLELIQWSEVGWTHLYARRPLRLPEDARGLPMRASNAIGSRRFAAAIGAEVVPVTFSEVIPALQTGLIEGGQSGVGMYALAGIAAEAPYLTLTAHAFDTGLIVADKRWWDAVPAALRRRILGSLDGVQEGREAIRAELDRYLCERLPALGARVHRPTPRELARWRAATAGTHAGIVAAAGGEAERIYRLILEGKAALAARR